jgi:spermidine synthase
MALGTQIYVLREYMVALGGDESAVGLGLFAWLIGIATGAALARSAAFVSSANTAAVSIGLLAVCSFLAMLVARSGRQLLSVPVGELVSLGPSLTLALEVFVVPGALAGAGFVAIAAGVTRIHRDAGEAIGRLYVFEAIGSLIAGTLASLILIPLLSPCVGLSLLLGLGLAAAIPAAKTRLIGGHRILSLLAAALLLVALTPTSTRIENWSQKARFSALAKDIPLLAWEDTPYEHVAIGGRDVKNLYMGGTYDRSFPDAIEDELRAHQLMLLNSRPTRVLAFGGIETGLLRFCLKHPVARLDLVILDQRAFELVVSHLDKPNREALQDKRVHVYFQDPRRFLANSTEQYDLILRLERDPATLYLARETTVQFTRLIAARLASSGTYVMRFSAGPTVQVGETGLLGASLYRTLIEAFPVVRAAPGPLGLLVAGSSSGATTLDPLRLALRWRQRSIDSEVFAAELLPELCPPEGVATLEAQLKHAASQVPVTRDNRPLSFLYALTVRQQFARNYWSTILKWGINHPTLLCLIGIAPSSLFFLGVIVQRLRRRSRRVAIAATIHGTAITGATGMVLSLMLLYSFQTRVGALYSELGLLTALFMFGLAAGGAFAMRRVSLNVAMAVSVACLALLALSFALLDRLSVSQPWVAVIHGFLLMLVGSTSGTVFPTSAKALLVLGVSARGAASATQFADHFGAALAAVVASVLFVPILGLSGSAVLMCLLQALAWAGLLAVRSLARNG